jgi:hypothetical protein
MSEIAAVVAALVSRRLGLREGQALGAGDVLVAAGMTSVDLLEIVYDLDQRFNASIWPLVKERLEPSSATVGDLAAIVEQAIQRPQST